jgi:serine/threonine-protein kinase HipA
MLEVRLHGELVGTLRRKSNGSLQFRYDAAYVERTDAQPLSQALPLQKEGFPHRICLSFFGGLLPEEDVRSRVARTIGISEENDYLLLERLGGDCAGAVTLIPEGGEEPDPGSEELVLLTEEKLDELLSKLPQRPLAADDEGKVRLSLAGAQSKVPVVETDQGFGLPQRSETPTTHILKPEPERFPGLVANEFFCMRLAAEVGLPVAEVRQATTLSGLPYLVVTRYDRDLTHEPIRRLHQEDLCQALGRLTDEKYQAEGGPTVGEAMELLNRSAVPALDRPQLWSALVFNALIGNCDAHGKNFSLLYDSRTPHLAPLYDLVSTAVYDGISTRLAMSIDGARDLSEVNAEAWKKLAEEVGLAQLYTQRRVSELSEQVLKAVEEVRARPEHDHEAVSEITDQIKARAKRFLS